MISTSSKDQERGIATRAESLGAKALPAPPLPRISKHWLDQKCDVLLATASGKPDGFHLAAKGCEYVFRFRGSPGPRLQCRGSSKLKDVNAGRFKILCLSNNRVTYDRRTEATAPSAKASLLSSAAGGKRLRRFLSERCSVSIFTVHFLAASRLRRR